VSHQVCARKIRFWDAMKKINFQEEEEVSKCKRGLSFLLPGGRTQTKVCANYGKRNYFVVETRFNCTDVLTDVGIVDTGTICWGKYHLLSFDFLS
jgi:hypothetical protein